MRGLIIFGGGGVVLYVKKQQQKSPCFLCGSMRIWLMVNEWKATSLNMFKTMESQMVWKARWDPQVMIYIFQCFNTMESQMGPPSHDLYIPLFQS